MWRLGPAQLYEGTTIRILGGGGAGDFVEINIFVENIGDRNGGNGGNIYFIRKGG